MPKRSTTIPHTLRIGDNQDFTSLNPHLATAASLGNIAQMTMAYLVRYGSDNRPVPELATEVPTKKNGLVSKDGLTITWRLRKGVRWSDGRPFDGDDVVFSTNAVNNPANNEVGRDGWDLITKMDQPDKYTVVFHLKKPYSSFLPGFFGSAGANPCLLPKHLLGKLPNINNAEYNSKPVGIGPFRVVNWVRGDRVEMERNPYYWRGQPKLQKVVYKIIPDRNTLFTQIQTGEIDLWPLAGIGYFDRLKTVPGVTTTHSPGYFYQHVDFNNSRPIFKDKAVREALRYAMDRKTIRDKINHGLGALQEGAITPVSPLYAALPENPFDLAKANALLDAAGWVRGTDGVRSKAGRRLSLVFANQSGTPDLDQQIELIRSTWQQIGVAIDVRHYAPALYFAPYQQGGILYTGKFDAILFSWQMTPDGDLSNIYECTQFPPNGQNDLRYCNPKTDALLRKFKTAYDEDEKKPLAAAIQKQVNEDVPEVIMFVREDIFSYNSDLRNWHPNNSTPFDDMLAVDI
ncbi:MAG: peptide ABC transporter substrate-binding protein [Candidatus Velthaea sp.]